MQGQRITMLYHVELQITDGAGKVVLPKQVVEQSRVFTFDQTQAIGTAPSRTRSRRKWNAK
jgi:LPS-assembly lipoprotein